MILLHIWASCLEREKKHSTRFHELIRAALLRPPRGEVKCGHVGIQCCRQWEALFFYRIKASIWWGAKWKGTQQRKKDSTPALVWDYGSTVRRCLPPLPHLTSRQQQPSSPTGVLSTSECTTGPMWFEHGQAPDASASCMSACEHWTNIMAPSEAGSPGWPATSNKKDKNVVWVWLLFTAINL